MQYILMLCTEEAGWLKLTRAEIRTGDGRLRRLHRDIEEVGSTDAFEPPAVDLECDYGPRRERQVARAEWTLRGLD